MTQPKRLLIHRSPCPHCLQELRQTLTYPITIPNTETIYRVSSILSQDMLLTTDKPDLWRIYPAIEAAKVTGRRIEIYTTIPAITHLAEQLDTSQPDARNIIKEWQEALIPIEWGVTENVRRGK